MTDQDHYEKDGRYYVLLIVKDKYGLGSCRYGGKRMRKKEWLEDLKRMAAEAGFKLEENEQGEVIASVHVEKAQEATDNFWALTLRDGWTGDKVRKQA
jgi:hypothetical protein